MNQPRISSAYIVHTQIIGLGDYPFSLRGGIRPAWRPLFDSKECFTDLCTLIWDSSTKLFFSDPDLFALPSSPFIRNVGSIWFNTRSARLEQTYVREWLGTSLSQLEDNEDYYVGNLDYDGLRSSKGAFSAFGYDHKLEDERMNYLCFELSRPLFLSAITDDHTHANGKVFIHVHPSGYIMLHCAISLRWASGRLLEGLNDILQETRPWRTHSHWRWSSKVGNGKLHDIISSVLNNLQRSIYDSPATSLRLGPWHSSLKLISDASEKQIGAEFPYNESSLQFVKSRRSARNVPNLRYLSASKRSVTCVFRPGCDRRVALRFFWKVVTLAEFVAFKQRIYEDYTVFLKDQIVQLEEYRNNALVKATKDDILKFSAYDRKIPHFLLALDNHIRPAKPFHRLIYSTISTANGLDNDRNKLLNVVVKDWKDEVTKWEPTLVMIWKKVISPLRSVLVSK